MNAFDSSSFSLKKKHPLNLSKHSSNNTKSIAVKLISKYANSYNILTYENENLKLEIKQLKQNIRINKDIINHFYSNNSSPSNPNQTNLIQMLKNENEGLLLQNEKLINDKVEMQKKVIFHITYV